MPVRRVRPKARDRTRKPAAGTAGFRQKPANKALDERPATRPVWDPSVRLFHWGLVASFAIAWLAADEWTAMHNGAGYAAAALVGLRVIWGFVGTRYARFGQFVRPPRTVWNYVLAALKGREARYLGHNPAGSIMVLALLAGVAALGLSGWLPTTDALWGSAALATVHAALAYLLSALSRSMSLAFFLSVFDFGRILFEQWLRAGSLASVPMISTNVSH